MVNSSHDLPFTMNILPSLRNVLLLALALFVGSLAAASAPAATIAYSIDFDGDNQSFPSDWLRGMDGANGVNGLIEENGLGQLVMQRLSSGTAGAPLAALFNDSAGGFEANAFADVTLRTTVQFNGGNGDKHGLLARTQIVSQNPTGYYAYFTNATLVISKNPQTSSETILESTAISGLTALANYTLEFSLSGHLLVANLFASGGETPLFSISTTDESYSQGYVGLRSRIANQNRMVAYDSFELQVIPEPGTTALLFLGIPLLYTLTRTARNRC